MMDVVSQVQTPDRQHLGAQPMDDRFALPEVVVLHRLHLGVPIVRKTK